MVILRTTGSCLPIHGATYTGTECRYFGTVIRPIGYAMAEMAYDKVLRQIESLKIENKVLKKELKKNSLVINRLESEAINLKVKIFAIVCIPFFCFFPTNFQIELTDCNRLRLSGLINIRYQVLS